MHLKGVLVEDRDHDTLLYAGELRVRITDWFFLKDEAELKYVGLENAVVKFQRTDSVWRQQFVFDYFTIWAESSIFNFQGGNFNGRLARIPKENTIRSFNYVGL